MDRCTPAESGFMFVYIQTLLVKELAHLEQTILMTDIFRE